MKNIFSLICLCIALGALVYYITHYKKPVNFDTSLQVKKYKNHLNDQWSRYALPIFQKLYEQNNLASIKKNSVIKIPKKIHQIWLGSSFPEKYRAWQHSWIHHHPDWEYILWTEESLKDLPMFNREMYEAACNYGEKSDIARYEILNMYGGLYVDTDFECLQSCDIFSYYDFYIGIQPLDTNMLQLGTGLIACAPGHALIRALIEYLPQQKHIQQIIAKTGPLYATRVFCARALQSPGKICAFPPTFFYPCGYNQNTRDKKSWIKPESYAIHHWAGSWLSKDAFVKE
ncbi:MAG: glycosyltransferase [Candidatus Babeliaceae bacterium]|jgi:mannosyltransferase OCH1-like enzyme